MKVKGFTLTELMISISLSLLLSNTFIQLYIAASNQFTRFQYKLEQEQQLFLLSVFLREHLFMAGFGGCQSLALLKGVKKRNEFTPVIWLTDRNDLNLPNAIKKNAIPNIPILAYKSISNIESIKKQMTTLKSIGGVISEKLKRSEKLLLFNSCYARSIAVY